MPLYTYGCPECGFEFDEVHPISESNAPQWCPECGFLAIRVIALGHGGYQRQESVWVKDVAKSLEDPSIKTLSDLKRFYMQNPNVKPKESHPAFPSSIGDVQKPDKAKARADRNKQALEYIRKRRAITVTGQA